jgi:regulatory protein
VVITALTPQQRRPQRTSVFINGDFAFGLENTDLAKHKLYEGQVLTKEQYNHILRHVVCARARDTALRFLGSKPRSQWEVAQRITADGYPEAVVRYVLKLMIKYRYIDDAEYARSYAASRLRLGFGRFRIKQELKRKGITEALINDTLTDNETGEAEGIREWLRRKRIDAANLDTDKRKRCMDALKRRGYTYYDIKKAMDDE